MRAVLLIALALAACAGTTPEAKVPPLPEGTPDRWTATAGETEPLDLDDAWWESLGDPRLDAIIREALARSPVLVEAAARVRAAEALARIAGADLLPHVGAGADASRQRTFVGESDFPGVDPTVRTDRWGVGLNVSWEVDLWGRIRSGEAAALADVEAQRAVYHGAALSLVAQTAKAYLTAVETRLQVEVAEANLRSAEDLAGRVTERFQRGLRQALDVKLAASEAAGARASADLRRRLHDLAVRQLETLAGRYPAGDAAFASELPAVPPPPPTGVPADVLSRRPDLVAAERRLSASAARVDEAEASRYPRISLTGTGGRASEDLEDLADGDFRVWSLVANLAAPIFEGGRLQAGVDLRQAEEEAEIASFANAVLDSFREVESALASERHLAAQEAALEAGVREAEASVTLSEERYLAGLVQILTVLESRRRQFDARSARLDTHRERLAARIDLIVALGGGFRREVVVAGPIEDRDEEDS